MAQQKVVGSLLVETTAYATLNAFKADIVGQFKPTKSHGQLESELATLSLKPAETVETLAQRVVKIKVEYEIAYRAELLALGWFWTASGFRKSSEMRSTRSEMSCRLKF